MDFGDSSERATRLFDRLRDGDASASHELLPLVHDALRALAGARMSGRGRHTLRPTSLVHEAWIKLMQGSSDWRDRRHFLACAARAMRHILADHARARRAIKRGGDQAAVPLDEVLVAYENRAFDLVEFDELLERLGELDEDLPPVVELRFFGGLGTEDAAAILGVSSRTVERRWQLARGWLRMQLEGRGEDA